MCSRYELSMLRPGRQQNRSSGFINVHPWCRFFLPLLLLTGGLALAEEPSMPANRVLRVCADPNNLPFTNERLEGFENKIAELIAREMNATVEYTWWAQRRGFFRNTLNGGKGDIVMGVPVGFDMALTTKPYYRSTYVFVYRKDAGYRITSFDDPVLRDLTIGVQMIGDDFNNTPPAHALSARGMIQNIRGYTVYGDYSEESPPSRIIQAVAKGEVDVAVAWGPMAGYFARRQSVPLELVPVSPESEGPARPFTFSISMGIRRGDQALKQEVEAIIDRKQKEIERILDEFGVPRLPVVARTNIEEKENNNGAGR
ncbi:MAG: substrate-binding domain-containing protein [Limisphaerales bacterium]